MNYWAGKSRLGPKIADAILNHLVYLRESRRLGDVQGYAELFLGMGGVMQHMVEPLMKLFPGIQFFGADMNERVMEFWKQLQAGWRPPTHVPWELYRKLKETAPHSCTALHTFVGYSCGFHGCYFRGNAPPERVETRIKRNLKSVERAYNSMIHEVPLVLATGDFFDLVPQMPTHTIYYLDPPYVSTMNDTNAVRAAVGKAKGKGQNAGFDSDRFWEYATWLAEQPGNVVYVSETEAPADWVPIWEHTWTHYHAGKAYSRVERVFVHATIEE